ncbi:MAG: flotillin [Calditrichaeota bacterium]|jgi:flotillin|nr:flotillin [Calditrichota bacterium]MBT7616716.1 flotillin [Calditrichota bacterium]MBT7790293.1 flotillin [Calditrichota bacterium]
MDLTTLLILIGVVVIVLGLIGFSMSKQYRKVGPNEVLIVSGGRKRTVEETDGTKRKVGYRMHIGGGTFVLPFVESAETLPLETYTISIKTPEVLTKQGVHIIAEASAQVKVASSESMIRAAAEQFLARGSQAIKEVSQHILEGYARNALGKLTVEEIYQNRDEFTQKVRSEANEDFRRMGLELLSFNLGDISDSEGYIKALGLPRIAQVKRDASVAQAEAERDTIIRTTQAQKEGDVVRYQVETEIASANRDFEIKRSEFQIDMNKHKAQSDLAYELERNSLAIDLKQAEAKIKLVEKESAIKIEEQEIKRRELELESSVRKPAEARRLQIEVEAEAEKFKLAAEANGRAEAHLAEGRAKVEIKKAEGISRIEYTRKLGQAEAEAMQAKADAFKSYNEAAIYQMAIDKMPEIAHAVSAPLSKIDKIVMIGDNPEGASKITGMVTDVVAKLPETIKALTGMDPLNFIRKNESKPDDEVQVD